MGCFSGGGIKWAFLSIYRFWSVLAILSIFWSFLGWSVFIGFLVVFGVFIVYGGFIDSIKVKKGTYMGFSVFFGVFDPFLVDF